MERGGGRDGPRGGEAEDDGERVQISRRQALAGLSGALGAMAVPGCGLGPPGLQCGAEPPASPALLAGIETLVVVMMENRSFDHHLGALRRDPNYPARDRIDGLRGGESNPHPDDGRPVPVFRLPWEDRFNPGHHWQPQHTAWNGGRNDGFLHANEGRQRHHALGHHDRERLPFQYALADEFTVCDRWFSSVMSSTWPNRFYLHAATSLGQRGNAPLGLQTPPTVWDRMAERCLEARNYCAGPVPWYSIAFGAKAASGNDSMVPGSLEDFFRDARAGNLPPLAMVDPDYLSNDAHPRHDLGLAEAFLASVYRALAESPQWPRALLVITHDEGGGFFDHVPPPTTVDPRPEFRQLGFRVPTLVIGPTVWRGGVVSTPFEHVSVAATLQRRYGIRSLGPRMDATRDLSSCIDPARIGPGQGSPPPRGLPVVTLSARRELRHPLRGSSQREYEALLAARGLPAGLVDPRDAEARFGSWLRHAQELGALQVRA